MVQSSEYPASHAIEEFILDMLLTLVEVDHVAPFLTDIALICRAYLPADDIIPAE